MNDKLLKLYVKFRTNEEGVTLVEYGVGVLLATLVGGLFVTVLAPEINGAFVAAGTDMPGTAAALP